MEILTYEKQRRLGIWCPFRLMKESPLRKIEGLEFEIARERLREKKRMTKRIREGLGFLKRFENEGGAQR